ncbi:MAG: hypothetical protein DRP47_08600 [Candidatus Zixiibacteriota bacterium]|nr:MAG: hypothetical protein DRP47_08600 [candidate division Zixibacteria bacterium]
MSTKVRLFFILCVVGLFLFGCSADKKTDGDTTGAVTEDSLLSENAQIANMLNDALIRLSYEDKSGLYELEFEYFTDENTYDDYLERGDVKWIHMDSIIHLDVHEIEYFGDDSAHVNVEYVFNSAAGGQSRMPDKLSIYKKNGRWMKPTITTLYHQEEYEQIIMEAEAAAEEEN